MGSYLRYRITDAINPPRVTEVREELGPDLRRHGESVGPIDAPSNSLNDLKPPV
jgi:hypothetical protein